MTARLKNYALLIRLDKPIGILLLLWPTLWALWLAGHGHPNSQIVAIFIAGVVLMRSAGCAVNDFADQHVDLHVARTHTRVLASGRIKSREALAIAAMLALIAFLLVLFCNPLTIALSFIGALLAITYPFLKRITHLPQIGLGFSFAWGVPMAFAAEHNTIPPNAWLVFAIAVLWPIIYDTMYAMTDRIDDKKIGVKSTAILLGDRDVLVLVLLQFIMMLLLVMMGFLFHLHTIYFISLIVVVVLFSYQFLLIRNRDPAACFKAFLNNHWVGFTIFIGLFLSYLQ